MLELALLLAGLLVGGAGTWLWARAHLGAAAAATQATLQSRLSASETLGDELRKQLTQRELETAELRTTLDAERMLRTQAETRRQAEREHLDAQRRLVDEARERLAETFKALSADVLRQSTGAFMELARETLDGQLGRRQEALEGLLRPLEASLSRYEQQVQALEASRRQDYGNLEQQVQTLTSASAELQRETGNLVTALRAPQVRGRWGEITLHRVVELAGLVEHCDFAEQVSVTAAEGGRLRPDMVVRLPGEREIVVDAKVPLAAYLDAVAARSAEERAAALARHAQQMRQHMTVLAGKAYWEEFARAAELVVMFVPGEAFVAAAAEADAALIEDGLARHVVVATPTTLVAVLRGIARGWRQERLAVNAAEISELGKQLYDRLRTLGEHFDDVGKALGRATVAFNKAVGSMETRVLPTARRFRDLGAGSGEEIPRLEAVDQVPRALTAPEFPQQLDTPGAGG